MYRHAAMTRSRKVRSLKVDRLYQPETNTYRCPAGVQLIRRYTTLEQAPRSA